MQLTFDVPDNLAQEVTDFVDFLKAKYAQKPSAYLLPNEVISGLTLSEQSLAKDWLKDGEDEAWAHIQHAK